MEGTFARTRAVGGGKTSCPHQLVDGCRVCGVEPHQEVGQCETGIGQVESGKQAAGSRGVSHHFGEVRAALGRHDEGLVACGDKFRDLDAGRLGVLVGGHESTIGPPDGCVRSKPVFRDRRVLSSSCDGRGLSPENTVQPQPRRSPCRLVTLGGGSLRAPDDEDAIIYDNDNDLLGIDSLLTEDEVEFRATVREFVHRRITPNIAGWFDSAVFPVELASELGAMGLLGAHLTGYGCPGRSAVEYGLAALELEAGDSGIRTFVSVQGSLAMTAIHRHGSEEQKNRWLPEMAAGRVIGCFGLTEPTAGSDPAAMTTFARRDGDGWVISGHKRWIGLASIAQVAVIFANTEDGIRGFLVPTGCTGFTATPIRQKLSMRASIQCDILLDEVRLPVDAILPGARGLRAPFACLNEARYGIVWGAMGAARDSFEAARDYAGQRMQFGRPLASYQLTQQKLVNMAIEIGKGTLLALHLGRLKDAGKLQPHQISIGKLNNVREAITICRDARALLGGNGITLDYSPMRHASNLESVRTYEGTDDVHTLIIGRHITGIPAFS